MRAVLDPNVFISALLSAAGAPARAVRAFAEGRYELVVSPMLLEELERALAYPKLSARIDREDAVAVVRWLRSSTTIAEDPSEQPTVRSRDPGDNYLIALAGSQRTALVSGDRDLLSLGDELPVFSPSDFLALLEEHE